jgi:catechol 2,3-dioxygenase-like lactoylglutathione lyase family enzyme
MGLASYCHWPGMVHNLRKASMLTPFHLAINVTDLEATRVFYGEVLGAKEGRSTRSWVDFDLPPANPPSPQCPWPPNGIWAQYQTASIDAASRRHRQTEELLAAPSRSPARHVDHDIRHPSPDCPIGSSDAPRPALQSLGFRAHAQDPSKPATRSNAGP